MSRCRYTKQDFDKYYDDNVDRYYQEREDVFLENIKEQALRYLSSKEGNTVSMSDFSCAIEEFEFPDEGEWIALEYKISIDSCIEQIYEEGKNEK